jgi:hypothetical protein
MPLHHLQVLTSPATYQTIMSSAHKHTNIVYLHQCSLQDIQPSRASQSSSRHSPQNQPIINFLSPRPSSLLPSFPPHPNKAKQKFPAQHIHNIPWLSLTVLLSACSTSNTPSIPASIISASTSTNITIPHTHPLHVKQP